MSEVTTPTGLPADAWTNIQRDGQTITAYVAEGGEQFPWAECNGRVVLGHVLVDLEGERLLGR